jgi:hypothetical protein
LSKTVEGLNIIILRVATIAVTLSLMFGSMAFAHSGRTDASGGHNCSAKSISKGLCSGYHYHNGGSSNSGSTSSAGQSNTNSAPKATPTYTAPKEVIPAGMVKVNLPSFNVFANDEQVANSKTKYPVIEYKDITYFPMTWNYTQALGLETSWDASVGFSIRKTDNPASKLSLDLGTPASKLNAMMPDFNIYVNDTWVDNTNEKYPLLVLNDVTYFPMTWKYAVEDLGLTINNENNTFYISK